MAPAPDATASRRQARRAAFVVLYQQDLLGVDSGILLERHAADTGEPVPDFTRLAVEGVNASLPRLDSDIDRLATGWTVERLGAVERAVLRLALWELGGDAGTPSAVAIAEAVALARRYASPEAAGFVNGILGTAAREGGTGR
jgi:N utilization substance protein B